MAGCRGEAIGSEREEQGLELLLRHLNQQIGLDLKQYKPNYLKRRIGVRMRATGCSDYLEYRQLLRQDPGEARRLINDLTINVTEFFRDQDVFEALRSHVIPEIMRHKREQRIYSLRAWSAGCATGEEPYSLAILFLEEIGKTKREEPWTVRITASDLDDKALMKAKLGIYEEIRLLPGIRAEDHFLPLASGYMVREEVKRPVRFLLLDLVKPPPLRQLDLILCRNVLIYFEKEKQAAILEIFRRCLRPGGFLVLGKSEAIVRSEDSGFVPYRRRERVYMRQ
ncbi:MAG: protein-glutamate O-methyltransferase CheR [Actinobacteria bacterium]|nr:protein-glutamate O-methyltransferase CheR [Actinomycetota bacterium]